MAQGASTPKDEAKGGFSAAIAQASGISEKEGELAKEVDVLKAELKRLTENIQVIYCHTMKDNIYIYPTILYGFCFINRNPLKEAKS